MFMRCHPLPWGSCLMRDLPSIGIHPENVGSAPHQVLGVATPATSCIQQPHPRCDSPSQKLVEDVDVDLAKLSEQFVTTTWRFG